MLSADTATTISDMSRRQGLGEDLLQAWLHGQLKRPWGVGGVGGLVLVPSRDCSSPTQLSEVASCGRIIYALLCLSSVIYQNKE